MQHLFVCVQTRNREQLENKVVLGLKIILSLLLRLENVSKSGMWIAKSYGHEQGSYLKKEKCITVLSLKEKLLSQVKTIQGSLCKSKLSHTGKSGLTYLWLSRNIEYTGGGSGAAKIYRCVKCMTQNYQAEACVLWKSQDATKNFLSVTSRVVQVSVIQCSTKFLRIAVILRFTISNLW